MVVFHSQDSSKHGICEVFEPSSALDEKALIFCTASRPPVASNQNAAVVTAENGDRRKQDE
jgi:hypothetical protein